MSTKLLIVDDSNTIRNRIARLILDPRLPNLQIVGLAANGIEALEQAQQHRPDLVTIDLTMPRMDGIECIGKLIAAFPDINILVVSALSDRATALRALLPDAHRWYVTRLTYARTGLEGLWCTRE